MPPARWRWPRGAARRCGARFSSAEVEELPPALHRPQSRHQQLEVRIPLDEVEVLRIDDKHRRRVVMIEEARIAFDEQRQVLLAHWPLVAPRTPPHPLHQRRGVSLE